MTKEQLDFEMEVRKKIKQGLDKLFKDNNLSQREFAKMFNFSQKSVSNWLNCKTMPKISNLIDICKFYKIKISYFLSTDILNKKN